MNRRTLAGIFKANGTQYVWAGFPVLFGAIYYAGGGAPAAGEWLSIGLLLAAMTVILGTVSQLANAYSDRDEDWLYVPSNPLVTGELDASNAKKALIAQNILAAMLVIALFVVSDFNYPLLIVILAGWSLGLANSFSPFRFKERAVGPFTHAIASSLVPVAGWLVVERSLTAQDGFIIAFTAFFFVHLAAFGTSVKLRKTFEDMKGGRVQVAEGKTVYDLRTSGLGLSVRTAVAMETVLGLGAFILVPVYWHLGIFGRELSISLLTLPLAFMVLTAVFRIKNPLTNTYRCGQLMSMNCLFIVFSFLGVALADLMHWGFIVLVFVFFIAVFSVLQRVTRPFGASFRPIQI